MIGNNDFNDQTNIIDDEVKDLLGIPNNQDVKIIRHQEGGGIKKKTILKGKLGKKSKNVRKGLVGKKPHNRNKTSTRKNKVGKVSERSKRSNRSKKSKK